MFSRQPSIPQRPTPNGQHHRNRRSLSAALRRQAVADWPLASTILVLAGFEVLWRSPLPLGSPAPLLLIIVVAVSAFSGITRGLIASVFSALYMVYFASAHGVAAHLAPFDVLGACLALPPMALLAGSQRHQAQLAQAERSEIEREYDAIQNTAVELGETTERMDESLSIASHELRGPLTSLKLDVQTAERRLRRGAVSGPIGRVNHSDAVQSALDYLNRADAQIGRMERLVSDLLDASRARSGRLELRPAPCDLVAIAVATVAEQRQLWQDRRIALHVPPDDLPIYGDGDRIAQVITNFITNALKYSPPDAPVIVRLEVHHASARLVVRDHGVGLSREDSERVWERFQRANYDPSTHLAISGEHQVPAGGGLGLGLYISKAIIDQHGGRVGVTSAPGKGSAFWLELPLLRNIPAYIHAASPSRAQELG